jgi:hypothetical protein
MIVARCTNLCTTNTATTLAHPPCFQCPPAAP